MKIEHITLENFRCFRSISIDLHPVMTVLVANNGQGKTTILDAIRIGLWPFVSSFDLAKTAYADPANTITVGDVTQLKTENGQSRQLPTKITLDGDYFQELTHLTRYIDDIDQTHWTRSRVSEAARSQTKDDPATKLLKSGGAMLQEEIREINTSPVDLPVFGYYGTGRLWKEKHPRTVKKESKNRKGDTSIRTYAYFYCLDPASSYKQFEEWFTLEFKKIREEQIKQLETGGSTKAINTMINNPVKVVQTAVNELLKETGWQNLAYSETHAQSLILEHSEKGVLKVDQMSDGIKNMVAMIADIAYRCALLNAHLGVDAALKSKGLVMIDEVDMHLHPSWQQTVIAGLTRAFPVIQFIVTTHSPQVLSTVHKENIRVIGKNPNGQDVAYIPLAHSYGEPSNDILQAIMQVDPQPPVPEKQKLERLTSLVDQGHYETNEAKKLIEELKQSLNEQHPQIVKIERSIRRQEALKR